MSQDFPRLFPLQLYNAVKMSSMVSLYKSIADKTQLHEHLIPITKVYKINDNNVDYVYYSADLLRLWLLHVCITYGWGTKVPVRYSDKVTKPSMCFNSAPLDSKTDGKGTKDNLVIEIITRLLITRGKRLLLIHELDADVPPDASDVATLDTMVKSTRLDMLHYPKVAVSMSDRDRWTMFHRAEVFRFHYLLRATGQWHPLPSKELIGVTDADALLYNRQLMRRVTEDGVVDVVEQIDKISVDDIVGDKTLKPLVLNPVIISYQNNKVVKSKDAPVRLNAYVEMVKEYYAYTGHKLDVKQERSNKTLRFRARELEYMQNLLTTDPKSRFTYDTTSMRVVPI